MRMWMRGVFPPSAVVCLAAIVLAGLLVVFTRTTWIGFLGYTPEWANGGLFVTSPLIAGAAALLTRPYVGSEIVAITGARRRPGAVKVVVSAWLRVLVLAVVAHATVMLVALAVTLVFGASGSLAAAPFVYAIMPIMMAAAIGVCVAAVLPSLWSSALAVVMTYGLWYLLVINEAAVPVNVGGATISLAGLRYDAAALLIMLLSAAVVSGVFLAVAVFAVRAQSFAAPLSILAAVAAAVVIAGTVVGTQLEAPKLVTATSPSMVCEGVAPEVCLSEDHSARAKAVASAIRQGSQPLRDAGVDLNGVKITEALVEGEPGTEGSLLLPFGRLNGIGTTPAEYGHAMLRPTDCAAYYASEPTEELESLFSAAELISRWLDARRTGAPTAITDEQIRGLYAGLRACAVDDRLLAGVDVH